MIEVRECTSRLSAMMCIARARQRHRNPTRECCQDYQHLSGLISRNPWSGRHIPFRVPRTTCSGLCRPIHRSTAKSCPNIHTSRHRQQFQHLGPCQGTIPLALDLRRKRASNLSLRLSLKERQRGTLPQHAYHVRRRIFGKSQIVCF